MANLNSKIEQLRKLNLTLRQQLERAELLIPALNGQLLQLNGLGLAKGLALFGKVVADQSYSDCSDGSVLYQVALLLPGGLGMVLWQREEYLARYATHEPSLQDAQLRFVPFASLSLLEKALLMPHVELLLTRLNLQVQPLV